mmetsp:Transcript_14870/g.22506  ORF Transcript_14870/g.22506 Transcript_14870/m.22506 type:complete len:645 (+) Transcript_14870:2460-4394(+)
MNQKASNELIDMEKQFIKKGIARKELLIYMWKKVCQEHYLKKVEGKEYETSLVIDEKQADAAAEFVLRLMEKFMLICEIGKEEYIVMGMIKDQAPDAIRESLKLKQTDKFCLEFSEFVPRSFYEMLVAKLITMLRDSLKVKTLLGDYEKRKRKHKVYKSLAILKVGDVWFTVTGLKTIDQLINNATLNEEKGMLSDSDSDDEKALSSNGEENTITIEVPRQHCAQIRRLVHDAANEIKIFPFKSRLSFKLVISHAVKGSKEIYRVGFDDFKNGLKSCIDLDFESKKGDIVEVPYSDLLHWDLFFSHFQDDPAINEAVKKIAPELLQCYQKYGMLYIVKVLAKSYNRKISSEVQSENESILRVPFELHIANQLSRAFRLVGSPEKLDIRILRNLLWILRPAEVKNTTGRPVFRSSICSWINSLDVKDGEEKQTKGPSMLGKIPLYDESSIKLEKKYVSKGNFGEVFRGKLSTSSKSILVAVKVPKREFEFSELQAMYDLPKHRNILELIGLVTLKEEKKICLVTPFCGLGSLKSLLENPKYAEEIQTSLFLDVAFQINEGLLSLHKSKIIHRDISCRNILVRKNLTVLIADFGCARKGETVNGGETHVLWTAPESLRTGLFTAKSDIWSLGVTFWEILTRGKKPY